MVAFRKKNLDLYIFWGAICLIFSTLIENGAGGRRTNVELDCKVKNGKEPDPDQRCSCPHPEAQWTVVGLVPELFCEEDDSNIDFYSHDKITELTAICENANSCEECPLVCNNAACQGDNNKTCDVLADYNYLKLVRAKQNVIRKKRLLYNVSFVSVVCTLYVSCILIGIYLMVVKHFRWGTLYGKFKEDPTQGMRSFRYERMQYRFDYNDPGSNPEDMTGLEDYVLYNTSEDEADSSTKAQGATGAEKKAPQKRRDLQRAQEEKKKGGSTTWPWEQKGYRFADVKYREGLDDGVSWRKETRSTFRSK